MICAMVCGILRISRVPRRIPIQTTGLERLSQPQGLAERESHAFARDRVSRAGGISDQGDIAANHSLQPACGGDGAPAARGAVLWLEPFADERNLFEDGIHACVGQPGHGRDTDFIRTNGSDVRLTEGSPVNLDRTAPGSYVEMLAKPEAFADRPSILEPGPTSNARGLTIGSHQKTIPALFAADACGPAFLQLHAATPGQFYAQRLGSRDHPRMKVKPAHADALAIAKLRRHAIFPAGVAIRKMDSGKRGAVVRVQFQSKLRQLAPRIRHQPFAAGFIDGRRECLRNENVHALLTKRYACRQTRWPTADHNNIPNL